MVITEIGPCYVALSGKAFLYRSATPMADGLVLFSADGTTFRELAIEGFGGSALKHDLSFSEPVDGVNGRLRLEDDIIEFGGEQFFLTEPSPEQIEGYVFVTLPVVRRVEYFCESPQGVMIYVTSAKYHHTPASYRFYLGEADGQPLREAPITNVARYRSHGPTYVRTPIGTLYHPNACNTGEAPAFLAFGAETELVDRNPAHFVITETPNGEVCIEQK